MLAIVHLSLLQSSKLSPSLIVWPTVVMVVTALIVFTPWGRSVVKISTKFGSLERQIAETVQKTEQHGQQLTTQQRQIEDQQRTLQKLVQDVARYSISDYIFWLLF